MIIISYSTEDNSDSLRRNRWHIGNTLIAVLHLRRVFPQSAVSNTHVNMEAGYWVKQMVRLDFPIIFIFSAYIFSLENTFYEVFFLSSSKLHSFPLDYAIFSPIPFIFLSGKRVSHELLDF